MGFKTFIFRWIATVAGAVALAGVLSACSGSASTTQDVSGVESGQVAGATPPGSPAVPTAVAGGAQNLYNVQSFFGEVDVALNTNAIGAITSGTPTAAGGATPTATGTGGSPGQVTLTIDQWYLQPNSMKLAVKNASNSSWDGSQLVYDGKTLSYYDAASNQAIQIQDRAQLVLFLNLPQIQLLPQLQLFQLQEILQNLSGGGAQVSRGGAATVAGRSTTEETITPGGPSSISSISVWRDDQTGAPLKLQVVDTSGNIVLSLEYTTFDPSASVSSSSFTFAPPSGATMVRPTPDNIAKFAGFSSTSLQSAQSSAGFQLYQVTNLPSGVSQQSVQSAGFDNSSVVALLYGTGSNDISTSLTQKPSSLRLPFLRGGQIVSANGIDYTVYQDSSMVVIDWTRDGTALTLATTEPSNQAMSMAESVQPVGAAAGTPEASPTVEIIPGAVPGGTATVATPGAAPAETATTAPVPTAVPATPGAATATESPVPATATTVPTTAPAAGTATPAPTQGGAATATPIAPSTTAPVSTATPTP